MALAIVSKKIRKEDRAALEAEGFSVLPCPSLPLLPGPISDHPDAIMAILGENLYCYEGYRNANASFFIALAEHRPNLKIIALPDAPEGAYPRDCAYNVLCLGKQVFYNPKGISPSLADACEAEGFLAHAVHQGYAACTVRAIGKGHAITADAGMAKALEKDGIHVLKIRDGGISLPPYAHGFIGGASGCFGGTVYFYGDFRLHPDGEAMENFIKDAGFSAKSLSKEPLIDLGGILFIE